LGHLRLGIKKISEKTGKEFPSEVDYFILDPKTPDTKWNESLKEQFRSLYGDKPKSIKIMFPPAAPELFFSQWYKRYGKSTLVKCKGDGETATTTQAFADGLEKINEDERGFLVVRCLGPECIYQKRNECGRMASLQVILPDLKGLGVWQINTGSYNSIVNINSAIDYLKGLTGRYAMLPITLMRVPTDIQHEGKRSKHYILQVDTQSISIGDIQKFVATRPIETALIPEADETKDALFYDEGGQAEKKLLEGQVPGPDPLAEPDLPKKAENKPATPFSENNKSKPDKPQKIESGQNFKGKVGLFEDLGQEESEFDKKSRALAADYTNIIVKCGSFESINRISKEIRDQREDFTERELEQLRHIVKTRKEILKEQGAKND